MSDQTEPSTLIAMADKRFMGRPGDNATEAALRACAQQWAFERQESDLRRIRAELAERRLAAVKAREEALTEEDIAAFVNAQGGREVHRSWRDTMLLQEREVAPERMAWDTLSIYDQVLDRTIALDVLMDYAVYAVSHPHALAALATAGEKAAEPPRAEG